MTTIAIESTGIYWIPLFELLESRGLEVYPRPGLRQHQQYRVLALGLRGLLPEETQRCALLLRLAGLG